MYIYDYNYIDSIHTYIPPRLYSDYLFVGGVGYTNLDFHNDLVASINMLSSCVERLGMKPCFFDQEMYSKLPVSK